MRWMRVAAVTAVAGAALAACEAEERQTANPDVMQTAAAAEAYDPTAYDTVSWASDSAAVARGRDIFKWVCAECHGEQGRGDGGRVIDGDTLRPASFHQEGWEYADDPEALHRQIFIGNTLGMPHWGLRQMRPRDIVALERYIRLELVRDDAAGG